MTNRIGPFTRVTDFDADDALWEFVLPVYPFRLFDEYHPHWLPLTHAHDFTFDENGYFCFIRHQGFYQLPFTGEKIYRRFYYCLANDALTLMPQNRPLYKNIGELWQLLSSVRLPPPVQGYWKRNFELPVYFNNDIYNKHISYYGKLTHTVFANQIPYFEFVLTTSDVGVLSGMLDFSISTLPHFPLSFFRRISKKTGEVLWESNRVRVHHRTIPTVRTVNGKPRKVIEFWGFNSSPPKPELYDTYPRL